MTNLNKSPSAHHHKCPHFVDVHKPPSKVEPRREIVKDDLTMFNQKQQHAVTETCVHLTASQAAQLGTEKNSEVQVNPSNGSKVADVIVPMDNPSSKTSPSVRYV